MDGLLIGGRRILPVHLSSSDDESSYAETLVWRRFPKDKRKLDTHPNPRSGAKPWASTQSA